MVNVKQLLQLPTLNSLILKTKDETLNNLVSHVTVMEVPDTYKWLKLNSLVITSLYFFDTVNSKTVLINTLKKLKENGCTCLAIKVGNYSEKIDDYIIDEANQLGICLLEIPQNLKYIDIINTSMFAIFKEEDSKEAIKNFLKEVLFKSYYDMEAAIENEKAKLYGYDFENLNVISLAVRPSGSIEISNEARLGSKLFELNLIETKLYDIVLAFTKDQIVDGDVEKIIKHLTSLSSKARDIKIGLGRSNSTIKGLKQSFEESVQALEIADRINYPGNIFKYKDLEVYMIFFNLFKNSDRTNILIPSFDLDDELIETMFAYYKYDLSTKAAAESLYIHENTLRYRLNKIKEITGYDPHLFKDGILLFIYSLYQKI